MNFLHGLISCRPIATNLTLRLSLPIMWLLSAAEMWQWMLHELLFVWEPEFHWFTGEVSQNYQHVRKKFIMPKKRVSIFNCSQTLWNFWAMQTAISKV